jgi:hypothetical protein
MTITKTALTLLPMLYSTAFVTANHTRDDDIVENSGELPFVITLLVAAAIICCTSKYVNNCTKKLCSWMSNPRNNNRYSHLPETIVLRV